MATVTPPAPLVLFARGTIARLALWPALRVAVAQNWGGPPGVSAQKQTWLASVLVDAFEPALAPGGASAAEAPDVDYVALTLLQALEDEFDAVLEDGSADDVARDVVALYAGIARGEAQEERVREWEARVETWRGKKVQVQEVVGSDEEWESEEDDEEEEGEDEEAPELRDTEANAERTRPEPVVDEDGFTLVQGKGKGRAPR